MNMAKARIGRSTAAPPLQSLPRQLAVLDGSSCRTWESACNVGFSILSPTEEPKSGGGINSPGSRRHFPPPGHPGRFPHHGTLATSKLTNKSPTVAVLIRIAAVVGVSASSLIARAERRMCTKNRRKGQVRRSKLQAFRRRGGLARSIVVGPSRFVNRPRVSEITRNYYPDSNASRPIPDCRIIDRNVPMRISRWLGTGTVVVTPSTTRRIMMWLPR